MANELETLFSDTTEETLTEEIPTEETTEETTEEVETEEETLEGEETSKEDEEGEEETSEEGTEEVEEDSLYKQIKAAAPDLLKKVPALREAIFREQKFTELFPTVEDAKSAHEAAEVFSQYESDLTSGNIGPIVEALGDTSKDALRNFVANVIPAIEAKDQKLYLEMLYPEFKKMLRAAVASGNKDIATSARNINWFIFNDADVEKDAGLKPKVKNEAEEHLTRREQEIEGRLVKSFASDIMSVGEKRTKKLISSVFGEDSGVPAITQRAIVDEVFKKVDTLIAKDRRHMGNINHLWRQARAAGFTTEWKDRITNAYLSRAKVFIPKVRQEVLKDAKIAIKASGEKKVVKRVPFSGAPTPKGVAGKIDPKKIDWSKTSERDLLEGKPPVLKG